MGLCSRGQVSKLPPGNSLGFGKTGALISSLNEAWLQTRNSASSSPRGRGRDPKPMHVGINPTKATEL